MYFKEKIKSIDAQRAKFESTIGNSNGNNANVAQSDSKSGLLSFAPTLVLPQHAAWFRLDVFQFRFFKKILLRNNQSQKAIHERERRALPEFFERRSRLKTVNLRLRLIS